jgi:hypothetical protein
LLGEEMEYVAAFCCLELKTIRIYQLFLIQLLEQTKLVTADGVEQILR